MIEQSDAEIARFVTFPFCDRFFPIRGSNDVQLVPLQLFHKELLSHRVVYTRIVSKVHHRPLYITRTFGYKNIAEQCSLRKSFLFSHFCRIDHRFERKFVEDILQTGQHLQELELSRWLRHPHDAWGSLHVASEHRSACKIVGGGSEEVDDLGLL